MGHLHSQKKQPEGLTPYHRGHLHKVGGPSKSREDRMKMEDSFFTGDMSRGQEDRRT